MIPPLVLALLLACRLPAFGQSSRAELIAQQQAEKAAHLAPEVATAAEIVEKRILSSPLLAGSGGVYPWFGSVYSGTGFAVGAGVLHRAPLASRLTATAAISTNGSLSGDLAWRLPTFAVNGRFQPWVEAGVSRLRRLQTWGVGSDVQVTDRTNVDFRPTRVDAGVTIDAAPGVSLVAGYGYLGFSTAGNPGAAGPLPGLGASLDYGVGHVGAVLDWRPSPGFSTNGGFLRGEWRRYAARDAAPFSFDQFEVEAAELVPFVREQFGLAFRALATTTRTDTGDDVPFVLLPAVGGGETVRSLPTRRYRDRSRVVLTGEYRWRPSRYLDMALFLDAGAVGPTLSDIPDRPFRTGYGIGARVHGPTFTALRLELAHGREGFRFVITGGQPF
ncbi:MAG: hypothetical protein R2752_17710 [Vicinamibacterales bacterium]